ncbi:taste receptor type 2 member 50-like [Pseudophryne corroboree]|uniref:taste receptor type 2 member 50-like n=1 Tax=Pseudophryne corroboree TaxID=495146 RepID=UPI003081A5E1
MINGFIVAVNVTDWMKQRPVTSTDQILTFLAVTRVFYHSACLLDIFLQTLFIEILIKYAVVIKCILAFSFYSSIWLTNLLSVVFCLKICNFHNVFFLRLKIMILQRIVCLIIGSVLVSICSSLSYILISIIEIPENSSNKTSNWGKNYSVIYVFLFWNAVPFLIFLISSYLLIFSLCHHMNRMRYDRAVTGQLDTYYKTITFSAVSFLTYAFCCITHVTLWFHQGSPDHLGARFILNVFPTLHSIYLIHVTARLKSHLFEIVQHVSKCLFH